MKKIPLMLCMGLIICLAAGCANTSKQKPETDQFGLGLRYMQAGDEDKARLAFSKASQLNPEMLQKINELLQTKKCPSESEIAHYRQKYPQLKRVCDRLPGFKAAYHERNGHYKKAIPFYDQMLEINPMHQPALEGMKRCYEKIGDFEKANSIQRYCDLLPKPELGVHDEDNRFYTDGHIAYERIEPEAVRRLRELRQELRKHGNDDNVYIDTIRY